MENRWGNSHEWVYMGLLNYHLWIVLDHFRPFALYFIVQAAYRGFAKFNYCTQSEKEKHVAFSYSYSIPKFYDFNFLDSKFPAL